MWQTFQTNSFAFNYSTWLQSKQLLWPDNNIWLQPELSEYLRKMNVLLLQFCSGWQQPTIYFGQMGMKGVVQVARWVCVGSWWRWHECKQGSRSQNTMHNGPETLPGEQEGKFLSWLKTWVLKPFPFTDYPALAKTLECVTEFTSRCHVTLTPLVSLSLSPGQHLAVRLCSEHLK